MNNIISLTDVSLILSGPVNSLTILDNINLEIQAGQTVSITGESGSGKTSLMMLISGVEKATSGKEVIAGEDITTYSEDALARFRRNNIGIVFQNFHLIPTMNALENVMVALDFAGESNSAARALEVLKEVGLKARIHHYPEQLSGGEQQRVALARAISVRPKILLADEPTGNLDSSTGANIINLILSLKEKSAPEVVIHHLRERHGLRQRLESNQNPISGIDFKDGFEGALTVTYVQ